MKHGVAFRKFSRTSSHRMLMLRNLVTSLFEHEQIKTTLPKARDAARLAEKIITMGKKGDLASRKRAASFLLKPDLVPKLFGAFAERYALRPGGYTRIHKFGNRQGDNAPQAVLELVDNPRDLRYELTTRAIGWDILREKLRRQAPVSLINQGAIGTQDIVRTERSLGFGEKGTLRPMTRWNLQKVLRFRDQDAFLDVSRKATDYVDRLMATPLAFKEIYDNTQSKKSTSMKPRTLRPRPGQAIPGETRSVLDLSKGALSHPRPPPVGRLLTARSMLTRRAKSA
ncbi:hypothetical protein EYR40_004078 [Pleurotus pulmonarius]|nr:hypothetical protein EYR40_004078 [Pleurotus pulmonarius]KAF4606783.1 hypothetical protein EYR38_000838 [Pleurotus pulmonarius]